MSITRVELLKRLTRSGLASPEIGKKWVLEAAQTLSSAEAASGHALLQRMVRQRLISEFQSSIIETDPTVVLVHGSWVLESRLSDPVWKNWFVARDRDRDRVVWLRALSNIELSSNRIRPASPSLDRALENSRVGDPALQAIFEPEVSGGTLLLRAQPLSGTLLSCLHTVNPIPRSQSLWIVSRCAAALRCLHERDLAHGRVLPDRVYVNQNGELILARDPLCANTTRRGTDSFGVLGQSLPMGLSSAHFLAPEFLVAGHQPTPASDVFALGCIWWWLLTGKPPVQGASDDAILAAQAAHLPELVGVSDFPEPLLKCLRHCLARNPAARFRSATELLAALNAVTQIVPVPQPSEIHVQPQPARLPVTTSASSLPNEKIASRRVQRRPRANQWKLPIIAGSGCLALLLLVLFLTGSFGTKPNASSSSTSNNPATATKDVSASQVPTPVARDRRLDIFQIVHEGKGLLWVPPNVPQPLPLDLLPRDGRLFLSVRPARLFAGQTSKQLLEAFGTELSTSWSMLQKRSGLPPEAIDHCLIAHYPGDSATVPSALRIKLVVPKPLGELRSTWGKLTEQKGNNHALLVSENGQAYYIPNQPLADSQSVDVFSVGPTELMKEVAEAGGAAGPLVSQIQRMWSTTDWQSDVCLFAYPNFFLSEGSQLLDSTPPRLAQWLKDFLGSSVRAAMVQSTFEPHWYFEVRAIGATDVDAGRIRDGFKQRVFESPSAVENWLVAGQPHPYWRALAIRFPRMLDTLGQLTRIGVENGQAILNGYLPSMAAENLLVAGWIASQDMATEASGGAIASTADQPPPVATPEQYLERRITLRFDQEAIEVALQLIADEANSGLPVGMSKLRFELDGTAFEKAGITRNQQIRNFKLDNQTVRAALTLLAKRGNPDPSVIDLSEENQKLIWVVKADEEQPGQNLISLTTRDFANQARINLPREFVKPR